MANNSTAFSPDEESFTVREGDLIYVMLKNDFDEEVSRKTFDRVLEHIEQIVREEPSGLAKLLVNVERTQTGGQSMSAQDRKRAVAIARNPYISKTAMIVGPSVIARVGVTALIKATGMKNTKTFPTEDKAREWLQK